MPFFDIGPLKKVREERAEQLGQAAPIINLLTQLGASFAPFMGATGMAADALPQIQSEQEQKFGNWGAGVGAFLSILPAVAAMLHGRVRGFHGTDVPFEQFSIAKSGAKHGEEFGTGHYFTESPDVASEYAMSRQSATSAPNVRSAQLDVSNTLDLTSPLDSKTARNIRIAINETLADVSDSATYDQLSNLRDMVQEGSIPDFRSTPGNLVQGVLKKAGFDSITAIEASPKGTPSKIWVVFDEKNIKPAFGKND